MRTLALVLLLLLATPARAGNPSDVIVSYVLSLPTAGTRDFVSNVSWFGFGLDGGNYLSEQFNLGISMRWVRYTQTDGRQTVTTSSGAITGEQQKAFNLFPLLAKFRYETNTNKEGMVPYVALGVGAIYGQRYQQVGAFTDNRYGWQFDLAPEVGVFQDKLWGATGLALALRYDAGFGSDAIPAYSALSLSIGLRQAML